MPDADTSAGTAVTGPAEGSDAANGRSNKRAWLALVRLSFGRHALPRQLAGISLSLLLLATLIVALNTLNDRWSMAHWRSPRGLGPT